MQDGSGVLVSLVIPACDAQPTLARALRSLLAQTCGDWEAVIVSDDLFDYAGFLAQDGLSDPRWRFVSTGRVRSGCHRARNVGLAATRGALIGALDADDLLHPGHLARLAPLALRHGAAADNLALVLEQSGATLYRAMGEQTAPAELGVAELLALTAPLVPLVRRDHAAARLDGIEYAEDVIANLRLIGALGRLHVVPETLYEYRVLPGSLAHGDRSAEAFDAAYADYIERLRQGDGFGLPAALWPVAAQGLADKRALNQAFAAAALADARLNFQTFVAGRPRP